MDNYKGIYYNDSKERKFFEGGAHFRYKDLFNILISIGGELHKEKGNNEIDENNLKNKFQNNNDILSFKLEKLIHKSENQTKIKKRTRNIDQISYVNNPNTKNSFNLSVAYKSYSSLNKNKNNKKKSRNIDVNEYFALDNNSHNKYQNKTSNTGFNFSYNNANNTTNHNNDTNINCIYKYGNLSVSNNNINYSDNLDKNLNNNLTSNVDKYNNSVINNKSTKLNNNININININNNYLNCLHNKIKSDLTNSNKRPINNPNSIIKKNFKFTYMKNLPIRSNYAKYKSNVDFNTQKNFNTNKNNNLNSNIVKKNTHNYLLSSHKVESNHNKSNEYRLLKSSINNNKSRNFIRTDTIDYGKSSNYEKKLLPFNKNYTKTSIKSDEQNKKLNICFSLIGLKNGNKQKKNISDLNLEKNEKNIGGVVLQKYIKKKVNQMCIFKNKGGISNNNGCKYVKKGIVIRNVDGLKTKEGKISSNVFKFNNISGYMSNKKK